MRRDTTDRPRAPVSILEAGALPSDGTHYSRDLMGSWRAAEAAGVSVRGVGTARTGLQGMRVISRKGKSVGSVQGLLEATMTGEEDQALEVASLLSGWGAGAVPELAARWVLRCDEVDPDVVDAGRAAYRGGVQWLHPWYQERAAHRDWVEVPMVELDIVEAYTSAMLRRRLPGSWTWEDAPDWPGDGIEDQDSIYRIRCPQPIGHGLWRAPTPWVGGTIDGWMVGEEVRAAGLDPVLGEVTGRWRPTSWREHSGAEDVLRMPRILRKRLGNALYGQHAKGEWQSAGTVPDGGDEYRQRPEHREVIGADGIRWHRWRQPRPKAHPEWAALTTARVRSALWRLARSLPPESVIGAYVDCLWVQADLYPQGLIAEDPLWGGVIRWAMKRAGHATPIVPGVVRWSKFADPIMGEAQEGQDYGR